MKVTLKLTGEGGHMGSFIFSDSDLIFKRYIFKRIILISGTRQNLVRIPLVLTVVSMVTRFFWKHKLSGKRKLK